MAIIAPGCPARRNPHKKTLYQDAMPNGDIFDGPHLTNYRLEIKKEEGQADRFLWHGPQREIIEYFPAAAAGGAEEQITYV